MSSGWRSCWRGTTTSTMTRWVHTQHETADATTFAALKRRATLGCLSETAGMQRLVEDSQPLAPSLLTYAKVIT